MFIDNVETAVILGAGFSKCAKLPLQHESAPSLLSSEFDSEIDLVITEAIKHFFSSAFYWNEGDKLPALEDIFTLIDLSANTGHNLGRKFTPKMLRALRRMLIYRVFTLLNRRYRHSEEISHFLNHYINNDKKINTHFIALNWDIVLEKHLNSLGVDIDYGIQAWPWNHSNFDTYPANNLDEKVTIAKVHGSSNWVYCDNCKSIFYDNSQKLSLAIKAGLVKSDFRLFDESFTDSRFDNAVGLNSNQRSCNRCNSAIGPHIATFSYQKSFRTHAFSSSWQTAEEILTQADKWIFIGYSLPDSDYEFKHLLKSSQLKFALAEGPQKEIDAIFLDDEDAEISYESFFGKEAVQIHQNGLKGYVENL